MIAGLTAAGHLPDAAISPSELGRRGGMGMGVGRLAQGLLCVPHRAYLEEMEDAAVTNRELAAVLIILVLAGFVLTRPNRPEFVNSVRGALKSLSGLSILLPLLIYVGWISLSIIGASRLGLWESSLLKETILWFLISGLALVMNLNGAIREPGFFRRSLIRTLSFVAIVEFLVALKSFPLWLEIPSQALAVMFAMVASFGARDPEQALVRKLANGYLALYGASVVIWSIAHLLRNWSQLDQAAIIREVLLPLWLTPLALLFVYVFAVVAAYQNLFLQMRIWEKHAPLLRQRTATMVRANGRLGYLRLLSAVGANRVAKTGGFLPAWREVGMLRAEASEREMKKVASNSVVPAPARQESEFENPLVPAVAAPLNASLRLALEQKSFLESAALELRRPLGAVEELLQRLQASHEAMQVLGPIDTARLIYLLARRDRTMQEIEAMALPIAMLLVVSQVPSLEELVKKFDSLLRLADEPADRAMGVADTLTAATQASTTTFSEMLDALIAAYS